jgi:hypothetical protein
MFGNGIIVDERDSSLRGTSVRGGQEESHVAATRPIMINTFNLPSGYIAPERCAMTLKQGIPKIHVNVPMKITVGARRACR